VTGAFVKDSSALGAWRIIPPASFFRHEQTLSGPKADRLELLRRTRTHTGQLFMLYSDAAARVDALLDAAARRTPEVEVRDEYEVAHRLWPVTNAKVIETIQNEMADKNSSSPTGTIATKRPSPTGRMPGP